MSICNFLVVSDVTMLHINFEQHFTDVAAAERHYVKFDKVHYKTPIYSQLDVNGDNTHS